MTREFDLDDAIKHCEEVAKQQIARADALDEIPLFGMDENDGKQIEACYKCADEHMQLAEWLRDYKRLKEQKPTITSTKDNAEMIYPQVEGITPMVVEPITDVDKKIESYKKLLKHPVIKHIMDMDETPVTLSVSENPNNCDMCDATLEERESIDKYIKSISKPTGVKFGALEQEPSDDCISRQAVLNTEYQVKIINDIEYVMLSEVQMKMRKLPSVKPQTGHWIAYEVRLPDRTILNYRCSVCGRKLIGYNTETLSEAPFCHCGARMSENPTGSKPEISSYYGLKSYVRERSE